MEKNISLKDKNTFKVGGMAKYYAVVNSRQELLEVLNFAKEKSLPIFIIGEGSNVLVSDNGFNGVVIKLNLRQFSIENNILKVESGVFLREIVLKTRDLDLKGLEWAIGIPGTVGGAICGNAGAHNHSISEIISEVEVFDGNEFKIFKKEDCFFDYRNSIFKKNLNLIILSAKFELEQGIDLKAMQDYLSKRTKINGHSIGSIFKNPEGYSAGKLIEDCNLKGLRVGDAIISIEHANWILNLGNASSKDIEELILKAKKEVKLKFNIDLVEEIRRLG